ncbi:3-isopropylmalate dehydratase small subunit [Dokdonella soli]|uniref:3-isopropylmalate dehydratase small subunit n=1 Tax=Dokdonella soli TaxID=529810 RepID=A0ABN1IHJ0_9GAMM
MKPVTRLHSRTAVLADENIDTDRIIPARFLTTTERTGLGRLCFHDWRYQSDGSDNPARENPDFPLNSPLAQGCSILVAGRNFGCGSSREHAPWALLDYGIHAVLCSEIADIFRNNALKNGLLAIVIDAAEHRWLLDHPGIELIIDVREQTIELPDGGRIQFQLEPFARHCLLHGVDQLGYLLQHADQIDAFDRERERQEAAIHGCTPQQKQLRSNGVNA